MTRGSALGAATTMFQEIQARQQYDASITPETIARQKATGLQYSSHKFPETGNLEYMHISPTHIGGGRIAHYNPGHIEIQSARTEAMQTLEAAIKPMTDVAHHYEIARNSIIIYPHGAVVNPSFIKRILGALRMEGLIGGAEVEAVMEKSGLQALERGAQQLGQLLR